MTSSSTAASRPIDVLVADSNRMQSQLLISALRRRPEFNVAACQMEAVSIVRAIAQKLPRIVTVATKNSETRGLAQMASERDTERDDDGGGIAGLRQRDHENPLSTSKDVRKKHNAQKMAEQAQDCHQKWRQRVFHRVKREH